MKPTTLTLANKEVVALACDRLQRLDLSQGWEVEIRQAEESRTLAQNNLMWMWYADIAPTTGYSDNELHNEMRLKYLVPIYEKRKDGKYRAKVEALRSAKEHINRETLIALVLDITSTRHAKIKEFTQYLNAVELFGTGLGCTLRYPNFHGLAMGIKPKER